MNAQTVWTAMVVAVVLVAGAGVVNGQTVGTAIAYQGRLTDGGSLANGDYDFEFELHDHATNDSQVGSTITVDDKAITNGLFTVELDFGSDVFTVDALWLEIGVRAWDSAGAYTTLSPRQELKPAPYALALPGLWTQQNGMDAANIIGGYSDNSVMSGVEGAAIGGGGAYEEPNEVTDDYGTVAGGRDNQAGDNDASATSARDTTIGGGRGNTAGVSLATIAGGRDNIANGAVGAIGGGESNFITDNYGAIAGGYNNQAGNNSGTAFDAACAAVAGGADNVASGVYAMIPGGYSNTAGGAYSFAAGRRAKANHDGAFVWADSTDADFSSTGANQFLIRAGGNVGIGKNDPAQQLDVAGTVQMTGFKMPTGATSGHVLTSNASGVGTWQAPVGDITGSGTANYVAKFTGSKTLGNSLLSSTSVNVGLGTGTPSYRFHVTGTQADDAILYLDAYWNPEIYLNSGGNQADAKIHILSGGTERWAIVHDGSAYELNFNRASIGTVLSLDGLNGRVGIRTNDPLGTLDVSGSIYQRGGVLHADYVFEPDYELESIEEHAQVMWAEAHLPAMPKARRDADGNEVLEIGSHRRGIVEELEKAHIYIEQLHKRIGALEATRQVVAKPIDRDAEIAAIKKKNEKLEARLGALEQLVSEWAQQREGGVR